MIIDLRIATDCYLFINISIEELIQVYCDQITFTLKIASNGDLSMARLTGIVRS